MAMRSFHATTALMTQCNGGSHIAFRCCLNLWRMRGRNYDLKTITYVAIPVGRFLYVKIQQRDFQFLETTPLSGQGMSSPLPRRRFAEPHLVG